MFDNYNVIYEASVIHFCPNWIIPTDAHNIFSGQKFLIINKSKENSSNWNPFPAEDPENLD